MSLVLAVEPDHRQANILKRIVREKVHADLVVVDSRDAAVAALTARVPDVILLTALLSPRDEEELVAYLRTLQGAQHIQTHTIPQLSSTAADMEQRSGGLFGKLLGKRDAGPKISIGGCDPDLFADEILTFIQTAKARKSESVDALQQQVAHFEFQKQPGSPRATTPATSAIVTRDPTFPATQPWSTSGSADSAEPAEAPAARGGAAWESPFEWRPSSALASAAAATPGASPLVTSVPLAVLAEDQEEQGRRAETERQAREEAEARRRAEDAEVERRREAAATRAREDAEAARAAEAAAEREREAAAAREREAEAERKREAEAEAQRKRDADAAAQRKKEEEAAAQLKRLEAEAQRKQEEERKRLEAEARRKREAEAAARKKQEEAEARRKRELEAEAQRKRQEEEVRKRLEAEVRRKREEAEAKRKREEAERKRLEAEAERKRLEAEARRKREEEERKRLEAEARRRREEEERRRIEAEAKRRREEEERKRIEAEAKRRREEEERKRIEAEARRKREEEERKRVEAEARRKREEEVEAEAQRQPEEDAKGRDEEDAAARHRREDHAWRRPEGLAASPADSYAEFRVEHDEPKGVLRLMPLSVWARPATNHTNGDEPAAKDDLQRLIGGLRMPPTVAAVTYPRGCRIRRVRVRAPKATAASGDRRRPVIVSRRALRGSRDDATG